MSKDKINIASKILFSIVVLLLLSRIVALTFKESEKIEVKEVKVGQVSQEKIISSGKEMIIKSFQEEIKTIKWMNSSEILVDGSMDGVRNKYLFSMDEKALKLFDGLDSDGGKDDHKYEYIEEIPGYGDLCLTDTDLGLVKSDGELKVIAENVLVEGQVQYTLSDDRSKLSYYNPNKERIYVYSFKKNTYKVIKKEISENVMNNFNKFVQLSPLGGYLSVEHRTDDMSTSTFSIYGADSGRVFAEDVMGVQLSWNFDDTKVCYYYTGSSRSLRGNFYDNDVQSKRIGFYDVTRKKNDYINSTDSEKHMISKIYWSDEGISVLVGSQDESDNLLVNKILGYNFEDKKISELTLNKAKVIPNDSKIKLLNLEASYFLLIDTDDAYEILKILKNNSEIVLYDNLRIFNINNEAFKYYYNDGNALITANENLLTVTKSNFQGFVHLNQEDYAIFPSEALKYLAVWFKSSNEIHIMTTE